MTDYLFLANNPALDFVNTEVILASKRTGLVKNVADLLVKNLADLTDWFAKAGLVPAVDMNRLAAKWEGSRESNSALQAAKELRGVLRSSVEKVRRTGRLPGTLAPYLDELLQNPRLATHVSAFEGRLKTEPRWLLEKPPDLLVLLAHHAAHFFATADYSAIRKCEDSECILWFYDISKNHSRRWCSMDACGNRAKVAAFRERL
jgi:predicted RNA-binding Zn ribbon-like protein